MAGNVKITLDKILKEKAKTRYWLSQQTGIKYPTIDRYYKNKLIRYDSDVLAQICEALDCGIQDILEYQKELPKR